MLSYIFTGIGAILLIIFLIFRDNKSSKKAVLIKASVSLCFIISAVCAMCSIDKGTSPAIILVLIGLILGFVGDITLDLKIYEKKLGNVQKSEIYTFVGMSAFGIGHICYIVSQFLVYKDVDINYLYAALVTIPIVCLTFFICLKILKMQFGKFLIISICYAVLLMGFMCVIIEGAIVVCATTYTIMLLIASLMFTFSDLVLSTTYFSKPEDYEKKGILNPESRFMIIVNHVTYYVAQFLIALSILFY